MSSCRFYMARKIDDLRCELASGDLPTDRLKKDLAWRLASLDDAQDCRHLTLPHHTSASTFLTSSGEGMLAKSEDHNISNTKVRERSPKQSSPSRIYSSLPSVHDHRHGDNDHCISNSAPFSVASTNAFLPILLVFLSYILRHYISSVSKKNVSRSIDHSYGFLSSRINNCRDFMGS